MKKVSSVALFYQNKVRRQWDVEKEFWYFSVIDVIEILTESIDPNAYWRKFKEKISKEGNQTVTNCHVLKMTKRNTILE